jgi:hypothetical protein
MTDPTVVQRIDAAVQAKEALQKPRGHLGASEVGKPCARAVWYSFRRVHTVKHTGRMLRLFARGHREEDVVLLYLRQAGITVRDYSKRLCLYPPSQTYVLLEWDEEVVDELDDVSENAGHIAQAAARGQGPDQWEFKDGHFSGSGDGKVVSGMPQCLTLGDGLWECKTSNEKRFKLVKAKGVVQTNPTHFVQMQMYMHYLGLRWALYMVVNKNDDEMHSEVILYKPEVAQYYVDRAKGIIAQNFAPPKIANSASWWQCRFCDFADVCHHGAPAKVNCRSCTHASATAGRTWACALHKAEIPLDFQLKGCSQWVSITDAT